MTAATPGMETVRALVAACNARDIEAVLATLCHDAFYHNIPLPPVTGHDAIRDLLGGFLGLAREVDWVVQHWAGTADGVVLTERTDRFLLASGWLEIPVMGTFEVVDGKIRAWRDYFDMAALQPLFG